MWPKLHALQRLSSISMRSFNTLPFIALDAAAWADDPEHLLDVLEQARLGPMLVVRSCAAFEDTAPNEPPGFFESILNVSVDDRGQLRKAIDRVFNSYRRRPGSEGLPHKVIVQTQLLNPL